MIEDNSRPSYNRIITFRVSRASSKRSGVQKAAAAQAVKMSNLNKYTGKKDESEKKDTSKS